MKQPERQNLAGLPQRYAEFLRTEAPAALQKLSELSLNYYREVWTVGLNLSQNFYRNLFNATQTNESSCVAAQELIFEGPVNSAVTKAFLVSNTTAQAAQMSFELSEFVRDDGAETVRVEARLVPASFELNAYGQRAVECTLPLPDLFRLGQEYRAVLRVVGFPQMQVSLLARTTAAGTKGPARKTPPAGSAPRLVRQKQLPVDKQHKARSVAQVKAISGAILLMLVLGAAPLRADEAAASVLREMERTYATAKSYFDTSSAQFTNPDGSAGAQVAYRIWFQRPNFLRIDATTQVSGESKPVREVLWSDGQDIRSWSSTSPVTVREKVQLAGSKMFGTYAYHIPTLLNEGYGGPQRLHQLENPTLAGEEAIDGVDCQQVKGDWLGDAYEIWIGKSDHLVRRILAHYKGYVMDERHREINRDQMIAPPVFRFVPEKEVTPVPKKKDTPKAR